MLIRREKPENSGETVIARNAKNATLIVCTVGKSDLDNGVAEGNKDCESSDESFAHLGPLANNTRSLDMKATLKNVVNFLKREDGPTAVEYAVMLALIVVVCIAAITAIGQSANSTFSIIGSTVKPS